MKEAAQVMTPWQWFTDALAGRLRGPREVTVGESFDRCETSQFQPVRRKNSCLMDASDDGEIGKKDISHQSIILNEQYIICNLLKGMNNYASIYHQM